MINLKVKCSNVHRFSALKS